MISVQLVRYFRLICYLLTDHRYAGSKPE